MEHVTSQELRKRLDAGESLTLLDIREQDELAICRLDGSVHFPMFSVPLRIEEVRALLPVVVYCHHGVRSLQLCHYLEQQGVDQIYNLVGGIDDWARVVEPNMPRY